MAKGRAAGVRNWKIVSAPLELRSRAAPISPRRPLSMIHYSLWLRPREKFRSRPMTIPSAVPAQKRSSTWGAEGFPIRVTATAKAIAAATVDAVSRTTDTPPLTAGSAAGKAPRRCIRKTNASAYAAPTTPPRRSHNDMDSNESPPVTTTPNSPPATPDVSNPTTTNLVFISQ